MIAEALLRWLFDATLATSAALLLVLALRRPLRRAFGARVAYAAWALVPLAMLAASLPRPPGGGVLSQALLVLRPEVLVGAAVPLAAPADGAAGMAGSGPLLLALAWFAGAALLALRLLRQQRRFVAGLGALRPRGDGTWASEAAPGPAVIGAWRPRIVLPPDFDARYPQPQAALVLAHEHAHVRRGDVRANLAATALRCLQWFNPLLPVAAPRFRLDQELACDATVLARHPDARRSYADAMLNTQLAVPGLPVGCHWQSSQSLKERIRMLKQPQPGARRHRLGALVVCAVLSASSYAAWALRPAAPVVAPTLEGRVEQEAIAIASVRIPKGMQVEVRGPSMSAGRNETVSVLLHSRSDLEIASSEDRDPWSLRVRGAGTAEAPHITWTLSRQGTLQRETSLLLPGGVPTPIDLSMLADAQGRAPELALSRLPADRIVGPSGMGSPEEAMTRDADGAYRQADPVRAYSRHYGGEGSATLLVGVGSDGRVRTVDLERVTPAGAFTGVDADVMVRNNVYAPEYIDGKPVPTRIRIPVEFARDAPPAPAVPSLPAMPAPPYPAEALAAKQGGRVLLRLLVATDGSIKDAVVESSAPAGVFDAVTVEAAKQWKLAPQVEGGVPVEGWVRVPVDFRPDGVAPVAAPRG